MIFQILIRTPEEDFNSCILIGFRILEETCIEFFAELVEDKVPDKVKLVGLKVFPSGFVLEGVAYGPDEDNVIAELDCYLKVLH